jgi:DNA replication protein DnaC
MECARWGEAVKHRGTANGSPRWLTLLGGCDTGKTHCARGLFEWSKTRFNWSLCEYNHRVIYWPRFISGLKSGTFAERDDLMRWPVLVLDDVLAGRDNSGFATDELNTILGIRMDRWTILTTNLTMEQIETLDTRLYSRIIRPPNQWLKITAKPYTTRIMENSTSEISWSKSKTEPTRPVHNDP